MAKSLHRLTARQVDVTKTPGLLADGSGLYLRITAACTRTWVFRTLSDGPQREVALGLASRLTLAGARQQAGTIRQGLGEGKEVREAAGKDVSPEATPAQQTVTFGAFAEDYIRSVEAGWRNPVHRQQWR